MAALALASAAVSASLWLRSGFDSRVGVPC